MANAVGGGSPNSLPVFNVLNTAYSGGADPTGTNDSATAIQDAVDACITGGGGIVYLPPGTYKVESVVTASVNDTAVYIQGAGRWATTIMSHVTGDCLRVYDSSTYSSRSRNGGAVTGLTIDGTNAGNSSAGLHMGDIFQYEVDLAVQNFAGTGSIGVHFDNANYWTEQLHGIVYAQNCTAHVVFDCSGADTSMGSFARLDLAVYINQINAANDGVVVQNGAFLYDGKLRVRGNFASSASAVTSAVLRVTGSTPVGHPFNYSCIYALEMDIQVECGSGAYTPQTIVWGGSPSTYFIRGCTGVLDFGASGVNFTQSNLGGAPGGFWFIGIIAGDASLCPANIPSGSGNLPAISGSMLYTQAYTGGGSLYSFSGDFFKFTLSGNTTMSFGAEFGHSPGAPQRLTVVVQQAASGGPYTVTWPHNASPTTTAPKVVWAGGTAPTQTTTASATDVYKLETLDGVTYYGQAVQNVS